MASGTRVTRDQPVGQGWRPSVVIGQDDCAPSLRRRRGQGQGQGQGRNVRRSPTGTGVAEKAGSKYDQYKSEIAGDIGACVNRLGCQPILFVGSGLSRRYFGAPSWDELLTHLAGLCPLIDKDYAYYKQTLKSQLATGEEFARLYQQWAWSSGRSKFPAEMFGSDVPEQAYIKFQIARHLQSLTPSSVDAIKDASLAGEIAAIQNIRPHTVITTNYDSFMEVVFPDYEAIIGQQVYRRSSLSIGEVFKIHGCVSDPQSLVFTQTDYEYFTKRKKYLSAKLLTYFSEHPLLFVGYGASDPNIKAILSDIDEALPISGGVIPNVYILEWKSTINAGETPARERLVEVGDFKSVRIKSIEATNFRWVFDAFGAHHTLEGVSPKVLRAILARSYDLVRRDIPRKTVEADFQMLENAVESREQFARLFGVTTISDPSALSAQYPYTLTDAAKKLGGKTWHHADKLIARVKEEKGIDIRAGDNRFHRAEKYGAKNIIRKYSEAAISLLGKVERGDPYEVGAI